MIVYFSASISVEGKTFTPLLKKCYESWKTQGYDVEIIYASADINNEQFNEHYGTMPWLAYPFESKALAVLKSKLTMDAIPSVAVFKEGRLVAKNAEVEIYELEDKAIEKWQ